jgi:hypothetical protein
MDRWSRKEFVKRLADAKKKNQQAGNLFSREKSRKGEYYGIIAYQIDSSTKRKTVTGSHLLNYTVIR